LKLLKIYLGEKDKHGHKPMFEHIVEMAYKMGMRGITVYKGIMGFGCKRHIHRSDFFSLSPDLPVILEIVDDGEKIKGFVEKIKNLDFDGLITISDVEIVKIGGSGK